MSSISVTLVQRDLLVHAQRTLRPKTSFIPSVQQPDGVYSKCCKESASTEEALKASMCMKRSDQGACVFILHALGLLIVCLEPQVTLCKVYQSLTSAEFSQLFLHQIAWGMPSAETCKWRIAGAAPVHKPSCCPSTWM